MEQIRDQYASQATVVQDSLPETFISLHNYLSSVAVTDHDALLTQFKGVGSAQNTTLVELHNRTQSELNKAVQAFGILDCWLRLSVPAIEDGNNFGVGIVLEAQKYVNDARTELLSLVKELPDYYKDRSAAVEKVSVKETQTTTESQSSSSDEGTKNGEAETNAKKGSNSVKEVKTTQPSASPDQLAHIATVDASWYLRLFASLDRLRTLYASTADFLEKNREKISAPKGTGGGLSMF